MTVDQFFINMIDKMFEWAELENDTELLDERKWLDEESKKRGITLYEFCFEILYRHNVNSRAHRWMKERYG